MCLCLSVCCPTYAANPPKRPTQYLICTMSDTPKNIGACSGCSFRKATANGETNERFYYLEEMKGKEMKWKKVEGKEKDGCRWSARRVA